MNASIKMGRIGGVPVGLHWSWFIIFALVTTSLSLGYFVLESTGLTREWNWVLGLITSALFFLSVLAHEFGHAILAILNGIQVRSINLFIFGGVAHIAEEPQTAKAEFQVAIAGPAASLAVAILFWGVQAVFHHIPFLAIPAYWLAQVNLALVAFNMLPGFPLDGGRVFRAIIWALTRNYQKATRFATLSGQLMAFGFIGYGIFSLFGGNLVNGIWLAFIGWFLQNAAMSSRTQAENQQVLDSVKVSQVMSRDLEKVSGKLSITQLLEQNFLPSGKHLYLVTTDSFLKGVVSLQELTAVPRKDWDDTTLEQVMTPWEKVVRIGMDTGLASAIRTMEFAHASFVPVIQDDQIAGLISRDQIIHYIQLQREKRS
jgi:Zn-dependent protease